MKYRISLTKTDGYTDRQTYIQTDRHAQSKSFICRLLIHLKMQNHLKFYIGSPYVSSQVFLDKLTVQHTCIITGSFLESTTFLHNYKVFPKQYNIPAQLQGLFQRVHHSCIFIGTFRESRTFLHIYRIFPRKYNIPAYLQDLSQRVQHFCIFTGSFLESTTLLHIYRVFPREYNISA